MADILDVLTKLVVKHETLGNILAQALAEHAQLILQSIEKCGRCKTEAATVRHMTLGLRYCDHCAATVISKAKNKVGGNTDLNLTLMLGHVMDEAAWVDLPGAIGIRRAQDLVTMVSYRNEPDMPEPGSQEWQ